MMLVMVAPLLRDQPSMAFKNCCSASGALVGVVEAVDIVFWPVALDFKKSDVEAMADDVLLLLRDRNLRAAMGESSQTRALSTFAQDPIIDQYEALYERILAPAKTTVDMAVSPR